MSYRSRYFSILSRFYPLWFRMMQPKAEKWILNECASLKPDRILEIGVGSGEIFAKLITLFPNSKINGIDISQGMLQQTQKLARTVAHQDYCLLQVDILSAQFEHPFDLIICNFVIDTLKQPDINRSLKNIHRNLQDGGVLLVSTLHTGNTWNEKMLPILSKNLPFLLGFAKPIDISKHLEESKFQIVKQDITSHNGLVAKHTKAIKL